MLAGLLPGYGSLANQAPYLLRLDNRHVAPVSHHPPHEPIHRGIANFRKHTRYPSPSSADSSGTCTTGSESTIHSASGAM